ncbi:MAG: 2-oxoacid:acceptor oxidoreductase family protein [Promethearchaeia archaeon]
MALKANGKGNITPGKTPSRKEDYNALCVGIGGTGVIRASMILGWAAMKEGFKVRTAETHGMSQRGGSVSSYLRFGKTLEGPFMVKGDVDVLLAFEISEALRNLNYINKDTYVVASLNSVVPPSVLTHKSLKIDKDKCVGCGNCIAHCIPNQIFRESTEEHRFTLVKGPTRQVVNGFSRVLESCTGCTQCILDNVCPFDAIEAFNEWEYPEVEDIEKDIKNSSSNTLILDANRIALECGNVLAANVVLLGVLAGLEIIPISKDMLLKTVKNFVPKKAIDINIDAFNRGLKIGLDFEKK